MKEKIITVAKWAVAVLIVILIINIVASFLTRNYNVSDQAYETTAKNSFISGCIKDEGMTNTSCGCAWDALTTLYGTGWWHVPNDTTRNSDTITRILSSGYNLTETNAMSGCW